ncbi:MAG: protein-disulfide reductase DsbD [Ruminobacter sp.]|nr:protein-disulfide reductase DsbD [Ruminobacter sp.]MDY5780226.1 protein-disulfide reductase DsbD [Succinivibrionaceae bacterium]
MIKNLLVVFTLLFSLLLNNIAFSEDKFLPQDEAFYPTLTQDNEKVTIHFEIAKNYYLYQEMFKYEGINSTISSMNIPEGIDHDDEYMGKTHIYYNNLDVTFNLSETKVFPQIKITYQGCTKGLCYPPIEKTFTLDRIDPSLIKKDTPTKDLDLKNQESNNQAQSIEVEEGSGFISLNDSNQIYNMVNQKGIIIGLVMFFLFGILLSLTPCVFPMYPIWSAIILSNKEKSLKTSIIYSFAYIQGLSITYMLVGITIASLGASFHAFIQQPLVLGIFCILFIVFALSMFGLFDFSIPTKIINKLEFISNKQKSTSIIGVFIMGAISAIIASPCTTAPLAGALIFIVQDANILKGAINLYALGLGMGLPLVIIGVLGQRFLPKNGNWMYRIKVLCGFLMLAVPLFLIKNFINTQIFISLWILLALAICCYLVFALNLRFKKILTTLASLIAICFIAYTFIYQTNELNSDNFIEVATNKVLDEELKTNNLTILDFRAKWCTSCKKLEHETFKDKNVIEAFKDYRLLFTDITENSSLGMEIAQKYDVKGVPVILVFKHGQLIKKFEGFQEPNNFAQELNKLKAN